MKSKKLTFCILIILLFFLPVFLQAKGKKNKKRFPDIVFPLKGQKFGNISHSMIFGSTYPGSRLTINGQPVKPYKNGAFLAFLPVKTGRFSFIVKSESAEGVFEEKRTIRVSGKVLSSSPESKEIQASWMLPSRSITVPPGEKVKLRFMGTPGKKAMFHFKGEEDYYLLKEIDFKDFKGVYEGEFSFSDTFEKPKKIVFELFDGEKSIVSRENPHLLQVRTFMPQEVYEVTEDLVKGRLQPGGDYRLLLQKGVQLRATGFFGSYVRLRLSESEDIYVDMKDLISLDKAQVKSGAAIHNLSVTGEKENICLSADVSGNIPCLVEEDLENKTLSLTLFSLNGDGLALPEKSFQEVKDLSFKKISRDVVSINVALPYKPVWGWNVSFVDGKMNWTINKPPLINKKKPLEGIRICLDAGHNPGSGAVGPTRLQEKNINWIIVNRIKKELEKEGAVITMTRPRKKDKASLRNRVKIANRSCSHLFISVHNNSVSNGKDPYAFEGTETYYYTPSSRILAEYLHKHALRATGLKDNEVRFGNFAVLRNFAMPCVLLELAYIIVPSQEDLLQSEKFQKVLASEIVSGIKMFLLKETKVI